MADSNLLRVNSFFAWPGVGSQVPRC